jgi:hypothetical protein
MYARKSLLLAAKLIGLTILYALMFILGTTVFPIPLHADKTPGQMTALLVGVLVMSAVDTLVVALLILRSRWHGWRLMAALAFSLYGVMTFMSQIEVVWFGAALGIPSAWLLPLFLGTLPIALGFVPLAVLVLGKGRPSIIDPQPPVALPVGVGAWAWRLALIAVVYVVLYFGAGYIVAWQNPELRNLYGNGADSRAFHPVLLPAFQLLRGVLWTLLALPVIRMSRGGSWQVALLVGMLFALPMNMAHAIPNDLMSASVRLSHFIETVSSNFIFGLLVVGLLTWRPVRAARPREVLPSAQ